VLVLLVLVGVHVPVVHVAVLLLVSVHLLRFEWEVRKPEVKVLKLHIKISRVGYSIINIVIIIVALYWYSTWEFLQRACRKLFDDRKKKERHKFHDRLWMMSGGGKS